MSPHEKVTVTLPDNIAAWLKVRAAGNGRSGSGWLAEPPEAMRRGEDGYDLAVARYPARKPRWLQRVDGRKPARDELHDCAGLRRYRHRRLPGGRIGSGETGKRQ